MTPPAAVVQTVEIPGWLPAPAVNVGHRHWSVAYKRAKTEQQTVWGYCKHAGFQKVNCKAKVTIVLVFPMHRKRDLDNLFARVKNAVDGIKPFLIDDSTDWLELDVRAEVEHGIKATRIRLEQIG